MISDENYLLEYSIDHLLKTFNPDRKNIMLKSHFFKLMNLLDTRLRDQGIDIKLPGYWYKFGFYTEIDFLDMVLPRPFSKFYMIDSEHIVPPLHTKRKYQISDNIKSKINSTVYWLWKQFGFRPDYGAKAKNESYYINSPYKFNSVFQDYIGAVSNESEKDNIEHILDILLYEFPEKEFSELYSTYLEWDDTTRLVLDNIHDKKMYKLIKELMGPFWDTYSGKVRILCNQHIPIPDIFSRWKNEYESSMVDTYNKIENVRKNVLLNHCKTLDEDAELVQQLMKKTYDMSMKVC